MSASLLVKEERDYVRQGVEGGRGRERSNGRDQEEKSCRQASVQ